jgi:threonine synthase
MGVSLSLGEGSTPLVRAVRVGREVYLKCEGSNPTGSFKDRGMVRAVDGAVESGARAVCCASTGNTAASAAAYAAHAGLDAIVLTPAGAASGAKLAQARACGARVVEIRGSFDDALRLVRELGGEDGFAIVNSLNPLRIEGQKSVVVELLDQLQTEPEVIALPYGGGGNVRAVAAAAAEAGIGTHIVVGQAAERRTTWASAIRIGEPAHRASVEELVADGRVEVVTLSDDELRRAWERLGREEGIFCEPASAAGLAALAYSRPAKNAVCILTGHGLKDTNAVAAGDAEPVEASLDAVLEAAAA